MRSLDDPGNEAGPRDGAREPATSSTERQGIRQAAGVQPAAVAAMVAAMAMRDLLHELDPDAEFVALVSDGRGIGHRCPACGRRAVEAESSATAWCASCGANYTRWALARRVLDNRRGVLRLARRAAAGASA